MHRHINKSICDMLHSGLDSEQIEIGLTLAISKNHFLFIVYPAITGELKAVSRGCRHTDTFAVPVITEQDFLLLKYHQLYVSKDLLHSDVIRYHL